MGLRKRRPLVEIDGEKHKYCGNNHCIEDNPQPIKNFRFRVDAFDSLSSYCKSCEKTCAKIRNSRYPWKSKEYSWKVRGIKNIKGDPFSWNDYEKEIARTKGMCEACGSPPLEKSLCVDHNHATGMFRGILCVRCNSLLGYCKDSLERLEMAKKYLISRP